MKSGDTIKVDTPKRAKMKFQTSWCDGSSWLQWKVLNSISSYWHDPYDQWSIAQQIDWNLSRRYERISPRTLLLLKSSFFSFADFFFSTHLRHFQLSSNPKQVLNLERPYRFPSGHAFFAWPIYNNKMHRCTSNTEITQHEYLLHRNNSIFYNNTELSFMHQKKNWTQIRTTKDWRNLTL